MASFAVSCVVNGSWPVFSPWYVYKVDVIAETFFSTSAKYHCCSANVLSRRTGERFVPFIYPTLSKRYQHGSRESARNTSYLRTCGCSVCPFQRDSSTRSETGSKYRANALVFRYVTLVETCEGCIARRVEKVLTRMVFGILHRTAPESQTQAIIIKAEDLKENGA
jgi:hypothetical protein